MIAQDLQKLIGEAMKAHDEVRLSTLRLLSSAFNYEKIEKKRDLTEEEEQAVVRREAKKRKEAIDAYEKAGNPERAKRESQELEILSAYLPAEISDEELERIVADAMTKIGAASVSDMGKVMGIVKSKAPGADGGKVAQLVKSKLSVTI